jgi:hypothetical protein
MLFGSTFEVARPGYQVAQYSSARSNPGSARRGASERPVSLPRRRRRRRLTPGSSQAGQGGRGPGVESLAQQQQRHRIPGVIGDGASEGYVAERPVASLPGTKGEVSSASGYGAGRDCAGCGNGGGWVLLGRLASAITPVTTERKRATFRGFVSTRDPLVATGCFTISLSCRIRLIGSGLRLCHIR